MQNHTIVTLKKGEGRTIKAGGMWIFDNEIDTITGSFHNGDVVTVHDFDGYPMGRGFINQNSKIRIRLMTRKTEQEIDRDFLRMRVKNAWEYRKTTVDTSSCRVIFGEADFLPGLVVDKYEDVLVVECLALGMEQFKETIVDLLKELLAEDGICVRGVYERSDASERKKEGLPKVKDFIGEPFDTNVEIVENGVHYMVDVVNGQKTGFFLDQKYNRLAMQRICKGKRVLDCFTHMGTMRALVTWLLAAGKRGSASSSKRGRRWLSTLAELHIRQELRSAVAFNDSFDLSSWTDCTHGHGRLLSCLNLRSWPGSTEMRWRRLQGRPVLPACAARRKRCRHTLQGLSDLVHRGNAAILVGQYTAAAAF